MTTATAVGTSRQKAPSTTRYHAVVPTFLPFLVRKSGGKQRTVMCESPPSYNILRMRQDSYSIKVLMPQLFRQEWHIKVLNPGLGYCKLQAKGSPLSWIELCYQLLPLEFLRITAFMLMFFNRFLIRIQKTRQTFLRILAFISVFQ